MRIKTSRRHRAWWPTLLRRFRSLPWPLLLLRQGEVPGVSRGRVRGPAAVAERLVDGGGPGYRGAAPRSSERHPEIPARTGQRHAEARVAAGDGPCPAGVEWKRG